MYIAEFIRCRLIRTRVISLIFAFTIVFPLVSFISTQAQANDIYFTIRSATSSDTLTYSVSSETITGVTNLMEYSTNGTTWKTITSDPLILSSLLPSATASSDAKLMIRYKAVSGGAASESAIVTLAKRQVTPKAADVKFNGLTESITGITSAMEYRLGTTGSFTAGGSDILVTLDTAQTYQIRLAATSTAPASATLNVTIAARAAAPNAVYNSSTDTITSVTVAREYSLDEGDTWNPCTGTTIPRSVFDGVTTVKVRTAATATTRASNTKDVSIPAAGPGSAPSGLTLSISDETLSGVTNLMEYSTNGTTWKTITGDPLSVTSLIPSATASSDTKMMIRFKAAIGGAASESAIVSLPKRQVTPKAADVRFNGLTESITGVTGTMEYRLGATGSFFPGGSDIPVTVDTAQTYQIRLAATSTTPASATLNVTVAARAAAPNAIYNSSTDTITGVTAAREYSLDDGDNWNPCTGTTIPRSIFDGVTTVKIRTAATTTVRASNVKDVSIPPAGPGTAPAGLTLSIPDETVSGVTNLMEYSTNGTTWKAISSDPLDVASLIPSATATSDTRLMIRFKAVSGGAASESAIITLPKRQATPKAADVRFTGLTESVTGITGTMEYRLGTTGSFAAGGSDILVTVDTAQTYQIRMTATSTAPASATLNVTVAARAAAPNAVYSSSTDTITGVTAAREYSLDDGDTWNPCTGTIIPRSVFDGVTTVKVRTAATATVRASNIKDVNIPPAGPGTAPTGLTLSIPGETITGVTNLMEYSTNGTTWKAITGDPLDVVSLIPSATASSETILMIRFKAVSGGAASESTIVTLPKRQATPKAAEVRFNGLTESITGVTSTMEYRLGTTGSFFPGGSDIPITVDTAQTHQIRLAATSTAPASATLNVTVAARAAAPNAIYSSSTDSITGVTAAREYSLDEGATWNPCTGTTISRSVFDGVTTVKVRTAATATIRSSNIKDVNIPTAGPGTAPIGLDLNLSDETVTGVTSLMEYSTNGTTWKAITSDPLVVASLIPSATASSEVKLMIRFKAVSSGAASESATITLPKRQATPKAADVKLNGLTESITGITSTMEYRLGTTGSFTTGGSDILVTADTAQTYQIRMAATTTAPASATINITVAARAVAPNAIYNGSTDTITGVTAAREYSLDEGATWNPCTGTTIPRSIFDGVTTVKVRTAATVTVRASNAKDVNVPLDGPGLAPGVVINP